MKTSLLGKLDRVGLTASALCAIHCAVMPFVITLLPLIGLEFLSSIWVEIALVVLSVTIGLSSLMPSYFKYHKKTLPILLLIAGFVLIFGTHLLELHVLEPILVPLGGLTIAAAHFVNWKFMKPFHSPDCQH